MSNAVGFTKRQHAFKVHMQKVSDCGYCYRPNLNTYGRFATMRTQHAFEGWQYARYGNIE